MLHIDPAALAGALVVALKQAGVAVEVQDAQPVYKNPPPQNTAGLPPIATGRLETLAKDLADINAEARELQAALNAEVSVVIGQLEARGVKIPGGVAALVIDGTGILATRSI